MEPAPSSPRRSREASTGQASAAPEGQRARTLSSEESKALQDAYCKAKGIECKKLPQTEEERRAEWNTEHPDKPLPEPKAPAPGDVDGGEIFGDVDDYIDRALEDAASPKPDMRTLHEKLEAALVWAFAGDGTSFFPTDHPQWYLETIAETQDEPRRGELLARLGCGASGSQVVTRFLHKLNLWQARTPRCAGVSMLPLEVIPLCALEALGIPPAEAHDMMKSFFNRGEHSREDPRRYKPINGKPGPGNPRLKHLISFVTSCCRFKEQGETLWEAFYMAYREWCNPNPDGEVPFTEHALSVEIRKSAGVTKYKRTVDGKKAVWLRGIVLLNRARD